MHKGGTFGSFLATRRLRRAAPHKVRVSRLSIYRFCFDLGITRLTHGGSISRWRRSRCPAPHHFGRRRSPRRRRNARRVRLFAEGGETTSALAEELPSHKVPARLSGVNLRAGGATKQAKDLGATTQGRYPRGRRNRGLPQCGPSSAGTTSAWAEEPRKAFRRHWSMRDDFHVGGGTNCISPCTVGSMKRSPRVWRNLSHRSCDWEIPRSISAWAEEPHPE